MGYRLYARRGTTLERVAEVDDYQALTMVLRNNRPGGFVLKLHAGLPAAEALTWSGLVVSLDDKEVFSGPVKTIRRKWSDKEDSVEISGPSDDIWLDRRLALPVPLGPPYTAAAHDVRSGPAETVMHEYVAANAGEDATPARQVPGLITAGDMGRGSLVIGRARFNPLGELVRSLALAGGDLGFRVLQDGEALRFEVYEPGDLTAEVTFSATLGNLGEVDYVAEAGDANYLIVGGQGEDTDRVFVEGGDDEAIGRFGRIEMFRDRRDTAELTELEQTMGEELAERAFKADLTFVPLETGGHHFGTDYGLGDRVTVEVDGVPVQEVIREVEIKLTPDGAEQVKPSIGTPSPRILFALIDEVRQARARLAHLERR